MVRVFVIHRPISREEIGFPLEPKSTGAILEYFHIVKGYEDGQQVRSKRFGADREFLRSHLLQLANRLSDQYNLKELECFQRVGEVMAGEPCMLVRIAAEHFSQAQSALSEFLAAVQEIELSITSVTA